MKTKNAAEKPSGDPSVSCPMTFGSPFLEGSNALLSQYRHDELGKTLQEVESLIEQRKVKELRQIGEKLVRSAQSKKSQGDKDFVLSDSHFRFTTTRQNYGFGGYQQPDREPIWHTVPFLGGVTDEDIALYSIITGKSNAFVPLRIAQALVDPRFAWNFSLSQIWEIGKPIPSIPDMAVVFPRSQFGIRVDGDMRLIVGGGNNNPAIELDANWRPRGQPICEAVRESSCDAPWSKTPVEASLVHFDDKYIWLSMEAPSKAALLCPGLIQLKDHLGEIAECLKLWRPSLGAFNESAARLKRWIESKSCAAPWIAHLTEMILTNFAPWPQPYHLRPDNDSARDWSSEQCLKEVLPLFRALAKAPLRGIPPNLVATFMHLIRRPNVDAHAWAGKFSEMWNFKVRTFDHSWINGEIVGEQHSAFGSNSPLKFTEIGGEYGHAPEAEAYCVSCGEIHCFIREEKNRRH